MDRNQKKAFVAELRERLEKAEGTFLVDYKGLNVEDINTLRRDLREVDAEFQVVKNRLLKLAGRDTATGLLEEHMLGPSAIALSYEDVVSSAKALVGFAKNHKKMEIKCGQISGRVLDPEAIKRLAELPDKDVLLAQVLSAMQAVPASLVRVLNGVMTSLVYALKAIEEQKQA